MKRSIVLAFGISVVTIFAACGGGSDGGRPNTEAGLIDAIQFDREELFRGDDPQRLYETYSAECKAGTSAEEFAATYPIALASYASSLGEELEDLDTGDITVELASDGQSAVARVPIVLRDDPTSVVSDDEETWIYEDGDWRSTACR